MEPNQTPQSMIDAYEHGMRLAEALELNGTEATNIAIHMVMEIADDAQQVKNANLLAACSHVIAALLESEGA